jgi:hypothetical protein
MIRLIGLPRSVSSSPTLCSLSRSAPVRSQTLHERISPLSDIPWRECSALAVTSYRASFESDCTGKPMTLWHGVNCRDYLDSRTVSK